MTILISEPPAELVHRMVTRLRQFSLIPGSPLASERRPDGLAMMLPHRSFNLSIGAAKQGELASATFVGWRFLLGSSQKIIGSIEGSAGPNEAIATHIGPLGESTARALQIAESRPDLQAQAWELQFLEISPLNVAAAWLRAARSVIVPLSPAPRWVRPGEPISEDEFVRTLQQPAARPFRLTDQNGTRIPEPGSAIAPIRS